MRLSAEEIKVVKDSVSKFDSKAEIFLFGSRVDDSKRGGDIDLIIVSPLIDFKNKSQIKLLITAELGEQKIDIVVVPDKNLDNMSPFQRVAFKQGIKL